MSGMSHLIIKKSLCIQNHEKTVDKDMERQVQDRNWTLRLDTPENDVICSTTKALDAMWLLAKQRLQEGYWSKSHERTDDSRGMRRVLGTYVGPRASLDRIFQIGSYLDVGRCQKHMVRPPCGDCHPGVI